MRTTRSTPDAPKWWMVDVQLVRETARLIGLHDIRGAAVAGSGLEGMALLQRGQRLSVQPVTEQQWRAVLALEAAPR